jgi:KaiC/GvpD/RAD55 family RecA-like ATPase
MIAFFTELKKNWPKEGSRDEAYLRLTGALARDTDIPINVQKEFIERLCEITNDKEIKNRVDKVDYQHNQVAEGKNVYGIKELSTSLNVNLPAFDELKRVTDADSEPIATGLAFLNGNEFTVKDFPLPEYVLHPIVAKQQIRQVFAKAGTGKSLMMLYEACAIASGYDFLHYKHIGKKTPVLYVEAEMDSSEIQKRFNEIESAYEMEEKELNKNFIFFATLVLQKDMHFESLTNTTGRLNVEITAQQIEKITGIKPIIYLDNITHLTSMQEKEGADWVEMMKWYARLRNRGYHVTFLHHPTKTGESASGSNVKERSIDIDMKLSTPDEKTLVEEYEDNHTQMIIEFLKWREHMNTFHSKTRVAIINRTTGKWLIVPMLSKTQRKIWELLDKGKTAEQIIEAGKGQEGMSKANVYKVIKILKQEGLKDDKASK